MDSDSDTCENSNSDFSSMLDFNRMRNTITASGYREGVGAGKDAAFQKGFDKGFTEGFKIGFALGSHNGIIETLKENSAFVPNTAVFEGMNFPLARLGLCHLCSSCSNETHSPGMTELDHTSSSTEKISQVTDKQREVSRTLLQKNKLSLSEILENANLHSIVGTIEKTSL